MNHKPLIAALACAAFALQLAPSFAQGRSHMKPLKYQKLTMSSVSGQDRSFAKSVAQINAAEIMLGQLAQRKGGRWTKAFGADMVREHKMADQELRQIASRNRISLSKDPSAKQRAEYDKLARLNGSVFDAAYRAAQIKGHKEAIAIVDRETRAGTNSMIKNFSIKLLPSIRMHLKMAQQKTTMTPMGR